MRIAFAVFEGLTALDFVGLHEPVSRPLSDGDGPRMEAVPERVADGGDPIAARMARDGQVT